MRPINVMKSQHRSVTLILPVLLAMFAISCDLTEQQYYEKIRTKNAEEQSDNVEIYEIKDNNVMRKILADKVERFYEKKQLEAYVVTIIDFDEEGNEIMNLTAEKMTISENDDEYTASGNVVVKKESNYLYTELLVWDQIYDTIYAPGEVTLVREDNVVKGVELRSDIEFKNISLNKVTAEGKLDEKNIDF
ncbi:MAG: LPS export ABC transporter periplasmic protein LptC [Candidatus Cloacimonadia bacterium]